MAKPTLTVEMWRKIDKVMKIFDPIFPEEWKLIESLDSVFSEETVRILKARYAEELAAYHGGVGYKYETASEEELTGDAPSIVFHLTEMAVFYLMAGSFGDEKAGTYLGVRYYETFSRFFNPQV